MVINYTKTNSFDVQDIPLDSIFPSTLNRCWDVGEKDIAGLADTIKSEGLIHPITVRPNDNDRFEIVCGEGRWRAFQLLEETTIPCFVQEMDDTRAQILRITENFRRREPSFMEQGEAVAALLKITGNDCSEVANRLGYSEAWVRRRAKLPNLLPAWRQELAKAQTPYAKIRDSVDKLEELAILPVATQQTLLDSNALRYINTTVEMRRTIRKMFMNLDEKPWSRDFERKAFTGYDKKRCDACMRRSDRESILFADPDTPGTGEKMCLDPECWKSKCAAWCKHQLAANPDLIPIMTGSGYSLECKKICEALGDEIQPAEYWQWDLRDDDTEGREDQIAAVGLYVDGVHAGTTANIWLDKPDEEESEDEPGTAAVMESQAERRQRQIDYEQILEIIANEIGVYLQDIHNYGIDAPDTLTDKKLRACIWVGISPVRERWVESEGEEAEALSLENMTWNPIDEAWRDTIDTIAEYVAHWLTEEFLDTTHYGFDDNDRAACASLCKMFEIPIDAIKAKVLDGSGVSDTDVDGIGEADAMDTVAVMDAGFDDNDGEAVAETVSDADSADHYPLVPYGDVG